MTALGRWQARGLPRALAATPTWVVWDEGKAGVAGKVGTQDTRRLELELPAEGRVVLAGLNERLLFGPTADCPLKSIDLDSGEPQCALPTAKRPVAVDVDVTGTEVAVADEDGEIFTLSATETKRWGKVPSPLALSLVGSTLFVVGTAAVYRLRSPGAALEPLFAQSLHQCEAVGAFGDLLAWQFGTEVRVIRRDAQPLEAFERR